MQQAKILVCFAILGCAFASYDHENEEGDESSYQFGYGVEDIHTGDIKAHHETKIGKHVSGVYTVKESDGTTRIVKYTAGPHIGFNAVVEKEGIVHHPIQLNQHAQNVLIANSGVENVHQIGHSLTQTVQVQNHGLGVHNLINEQLGHDQIYAQQHQW